MNLSACICSTALGPFRLLSNGKQLLEVEFPPFEACETETSTSDPILKQTCEQLQAFSDGQLRQFDLPLAPQGTDFQQKVWQALLHIPWGETRSYLQIAQAIGNPKGVRAVAQAIGRNPIGVIIPCHRVIGKDGSLTGFGGGLPMKKALLTLEGMDFS